MDGAPVQFIEQSTELRHRQPHHSVLNAWPTEAALFESFGHQAEARAVPPDQLYPVRSFGAEHINNAGKRIAPILSLDERGERVRAFTKIHGLVAISTLASVDGPITALPSARQSPL